MRYFPQLLGQFPDVWVLKKEVLTLLPQLQPQLALARLPLLLRQVLQRQLRQLAPLPAQQPRPHLLRLQPAALRPQLQAVQRVLHQVQLQPPALHQLAVALLEALALVHRRHERLVVHRQRPVQQPVLQQPYK